MPTPQQHCSLCRVFIYSAMLAITKERFAIHFITLPLVPSPMQLLLSIPLVSNARCLLSLWGGWDGVSCSLLSSQVWWSCFWDESIWCIWDAALAHPFVFGSCSTIWVLGSMFPIYLSFQSQQVSFLLLLVRWFGNASAPYIFSAWVLFFPFFFSNGYYLLGFLHSVFATVNGVFNG